MCCSWWSSCFGKRKYDTIPDNNIDSEYNEESKLNGIDLNCSIFNGIELGQKFTSKYVYEKKFVWVHLKNKTIHMSQYMTKDRRHKEASLTDVTDIVSGPPSKLKQSPTKENEIRGEECLTVAFKRGGGIDLKFNSQSERDKWFDTLTKIVSNNR